MSLGPRLRSGLVLAGVVGMMFGVSLFGLASLGGASAPSTSSHARLSTSFHAMCPANVTLVTNPSFVRAHLPVTIQVLVHFAPAIAPLCQYGAHTVVVGLPAGCAMPVVTAVTCVPATPGTFLVLTTVFAQNTATTVVDTVVVH
jgi:hypothetical protein